MHEIDTYLEKKFEIATALVEEGRSASELMERSLSYFEFPELVQLRKQFLSSSDRARGLPFLAIGHFGGLSREERIAAFVVVLELDAEASRLDIERRFAKYSDDQFLLQQEASIPGAIRKEELVGQDFFRHENRSGLVQLDAGWGRIERLLAPELLRWTQSEFLGKPLFVRLDPWYWSKDKPLEPLREAAVRPVQPGWWAKLMLRKNARDGGYYVLQNPGDATPQNVDHFLDYRLRGVRSLEAFAKREAGGRISMMVEEIVDDSSPERQMVLGRCLHLDSDATEGTAVDEAPVHHLDLAINVYFDDAADRRMGMRLSDGKVENASVRTHLLRIEDIPFAASLEFARQFFISELLFLEWVGDLTRAT